MATEITETEYLALIKTNSMQIEEHLGRGKRNYDKPANCAYRRKKT